MLTATYSLLSLSVEQKSVHKLLSSIQQLVQDSCAGKRCIDPPILESAISQLTKLDEFFRQRKLEIYVIPAIRKATQEADSLLIELESLSAIGLAILESVRQQVRQGSNQSVTEVKTLYSSIELYCNHLFRRLSKEEDELLPLAQRVISSEEWFSIGIQFLSIDTESKRTGNSQMLCGVPSH